MLGCVELGRCQWLCDKKGLDESLSLLYVAGHSIYPVPKELILEGDVTCNVLEQEKRPARNVDHLTVVGWDALRITLDNTSPCHRVRSNFLVILVISHQLSPVELAEVLAPRMTDNDATLYPMDEYPARTDEKPSAGASSAAGYARCVLTAGKEYIEQHRASLLRNDLKEEEKA